MTKTFWAYWQKRIGETKNIFLFSNWNNYHTKLLRNFYGVEDEIIKATFNGDNVDLIIVRKNSTIKNGKLNYHAENEYLTLNRLEIASIEFKK